ncbi:MAG: CBS domain-containing protein [Sedimentisphaerales bacterium]|nr:CBS domain-containing protein [Sedimentisphaerales bacterium]
MSTENTQFILIDIIEQMCNEQNIYLKPMRFARDIMNSEVKTLTLDHTVNQCLEFMKNYQVRHIPVMDIPYEGETKPYFVGVISERDVLRLTAPVQGQDGQLKKDQQALRQLLMKIVTRKPKFVTPLTPISDVITTMTSNHIDMVPVLEGDDLAGVITTTDLIKLFIRLEEAIQGLCPKSENDLAPFQTSCGNSSKVEFLQAWLNREVREIMTEQVISLGPEDDIGRAMEIMQNNNFRHIPIIDESDRCIGMISDRDILRNLPYADKQSKSLSEKFREHLFSSSFMVTNFLMPTENIMARNVSNISANCKICEAAYILFKKRISCLPVIDVNEKLLGILTIIDMIRALLAAYEPAGKTGLIPNQNRTY